MEWEWDTKTWNWDVMLSCGDAQYSTNMRHQASVQVSHKTNDSGVQFTLRKRSACNVSILGM